MESKRYGKADFMESLEEWLVKELTKRHASITTAESCTGGLVSGRIVNVSGASEVFGQGFVTYSNEAKQSLLGVSEDTLNTVGAVSEETAAQMAEGAARAADSQVALSVTGIAGPEGGTPEKPVGLVYIGCTCFGKTTVEKHVFKGDRTEVRESSVEAALALAKKCLKE